MDHLRQDIKYAIRRLVRAPGFTLVAMLTLGLGIGANSAIFSVVNGVLLQPLPYPESDRLVGVYHVSEGRRVVMSGPNFMDVVRASKSLESAAATTRERKILTGEGEPVRLDVAEVSASLFNVLRVRPALGRTFAADEDTPGKTNVVVLSNGLWQQRFGGDPGVIGRRIQLDGVSKEIIGVMPAGFSYPAGRQAWLPIEYEEGLRQQAARSVVPRGRGAAQAGRHAGAGGRRGADHRPQPGEAVSRRQRERRHDDVSAARGDGRATSGRRCSCCSARSGSSC